MTYTFICNNNHVTEIERSMMDDIPQKLECSSCKKIAYRDWNDSSIHIPENFKAGSLGNQDYMGNTDYLKKRMNIKPSGRKKIYNGKGYDKSKIGS